MTLSRVEDDPPRRRRKLSDGYTTISPSISCSLTRLSGATNITNIDSMVVTPKYNLPQGQSPPGKMPTVKKHHYHYINLPRSKSESEIAQHRPIFKKKGLNSPGGNNRVLVQSPTTVVSPSHKHRSLGKMWIRPVSAKNKQSMVIGQQRVGSSISAPPPIPFLSGFGRQSTSFSRIEPHEDMLFYQTSNSSFDALQYKSQLETYSSSKKLACTFGESGKTPTSSITNCLLFSDPD